MANPSIPMSDEMQSDLDDRRHATTSRAAWIREAIRVRMLLEERDEFDSLLGEAPAFSDSDASGEQPADD